MKKFAAIQKFALVALLAMIFVGGPSLSYAGNQDKVLKKIRQQVENAGPDDWETLAMAAKKCIRKKINMEEAHEWLDRSIAIKKSSMNLEIMGDYYLKNKLPRKAVIYYLESKKVGMETNKDFDYYHLEEKIAQASDLRTSLG